MSLQAKNSFWQSKWLYILLFGGGLLFCLFYYITLRGAGGIIPEFYDWEEHWKASAYVLRGIEPFDAVHKAVLPEVGKMMENYISVPWSYLLSTIMAPGFLPMGIAKVYSIGFFIALIIGIIFCMNRIFSLLFNDAQPLVIGLFILAYPKLTAVWIQGNNALLVSAFLLYALCAVLYEKDILAGAFMGFAMVKPQVALLFFIPLLFMKRFKTIATAAIIVIGTWIITCIILNENIIDTLTMTMERGMNQTGDTRYAGIMTLFTLFGFSRGAVMKMSMGMGIILEFVFTILIYRKNKNNPNKFNEYLMFAVTSIITCLWMYCSPGDFVVQVTVILLLIKYYSSLNDISVSKRLGLLLLIVFAYRYVDHGIGIVIKLLFESHYFVIDRYVTFLLDISFILLAVYLYRKSDKISEVCTNKQ